MRWGYRLSCCRLARRYRCSVGQAGPIGGPLDKSGGDDSRDSRSVFSGRAGRCLFNWGIPEIIRDGENGFLVPECNASALGRKIMEVIETDLGAVARTARMDWERNYSVQRYGEQMTRIIGGCVPADVCAPAM